MSKSHTQKAVSCSLSEHQRRPLGSAVNSTLVNAIFEVPLLVKNAGHLGGAGYHASMAAKQGCIGQVLIYLHPITNSE